MRRRHATHRGRRRSNHPPLSPPHGRPRPARRGRPTRRPRGGHSLAAESPRGRRGSTRSPISHRRLRRPGWPRARAIEAARLRRGGGHPLSQEKTHARPLPSAHHVTRRPPARHATRRQSALLVAGRWTAADRPRAVRRVRGLARRRRTAAPRLVERQPARPVRRAGCEVAHGIAWQRRRLARRWPMGRLPSGRRLLALNRQPPTWAIWASSSS